MTELIGITGRARSGKDTVATILRDLDPSYEVESLAAPMKGAISGWLRDEEMWNDDRKEKALPLINASPRRLAQTLGTEWGRNTISPEFWLHVLALTIDRYEMNKVIIPDIRFANEADWVLANDGFLIEVRRQGDGIGQGHASEQGIHPVKPHVVIINDGTLDQLRDVVKSVWERKQTLRDYGGGILVSRPFTILPPDRAA